jgi:hypothetical protein
MIVVSVKAPAPPAKCLCAVAWDATYQVATPERQAVNDIRFTLEYTVS